MKKISKPFISTSCIVCLILILIIAFIVSFINKARLESWVVSCNNHERALWFQLNDLIEENKYLPSDTTKLGYIFLAELTSTFGGNTSCNHGAQNSPFGGWQMVNLTPKAWEKVFKRWKPDSGDPIPYIWCGRPTGIGVRVVTGIHYPPSEGRSALFHFNMKEEELKELLKRLNDILKEIGEKPVPINIPKGIDWSKYKQEIEKKIFQTRHPPRRKFEGSSIQENGYYI